MAFHDAVQSRGRETQLPHVSLFAEKVYKDVRHKGGLFWSPLCLFFT
jgi:hypothetical protein